MTENKKADLKSLIPWLEAKDPAGTYNSINVNSCLMAEFFGSRAKAIMRANFTPEALEKYKSVPVCNVIYNESHTYGAALERCRRYLAGG